MDKKYIIPIVFAILIIGIFITAEVLIIRNWNRRGSLSFTDEDVIITIDDEDASFYARYGLKNYGDLNSYTISLPFALKPWDINLTLDGEPLEYSWTKSYVDPEPELFDTIFFHIDIEPMESKNVIVTYKRDYEIVQENNSNVILFRYIVGSTRSWGESLDFAHFEFWWEEDSAKTLIEERDYTNWFPEETFLYFKYAI